VEAVAEGGSVGAVPAISAAPISAGAVCADAVIGAAGDANTDTYHRSYCAQLDHCGTCSQSASGRGSGADAASATCAACARQISGHPCGGCSRIQ
jgi:hypothetical protein